MNAAPLIELTDIRKTYNPGTSAAVEVLRGITLTIHAGEFVAIMGQSGSGKSTLMNILGLLDRPSSGTFRFEGRDVAFLDVDDLTALRRQAFGFVFQQYNLIPTLSAVENVEVPAAYAGLSTAERRARSTHLLDMLGLADRLTHRPSELSGGQQQRVSIARALMNGGQVILADEPTGALDSASGAHVMDLLTSLSREGHTVILITHDRSIAGVAHRIVEVRDGLIVAETPGDRLQEAGGDHGPPMKALPGRPAAAGQLSPFALVSEALRAGSGALLASPVRTSLTLLGIVAGIASVITLLAIGQGAKQSVMAELTMFGANRLNIFPGGNDSRGPGGRLLEADAALIRSIPNVMTVMPDIWGKVTVRAGNIDAIVDATATTSDFPDVMTWHLEEGVFFTSSDERSLATVAVIGSRLKERMFPDGSTAIRRTILVNNTQFQVIGVLARKGSLFGDNSNDDMLVIPLSTGSLRVFGKRELGRITVTIADVARSKEAANAITAVLETAHRTRDFTVRDQIATIETNNKILDILTLLLAGTAAISLFVGGVGVMNVMLMTVTERTREIGIRMATGARTRDILRQFLTEAMVVSGIGGLVGVVVGIAIGVAAALVLGIPVLFTATAITAAVACAILTGLIFGIAPAVRAARLEPVAALARE